MSFRTRHYQGYYRTKHHHSGIHWPSLLGLLTCIAITFAIGIGFTKADKANLTAQASEASAEQSQAETQAVFADKQALLEQNQILQDRLDHKTGTVASETIKQLSIYYIHKYFPEDQWEMAEKIARCESGLSNMAVNDRNTNGSTDRGLWQINSVHADRFEKMYGVKWEVGAHDFELSTRYAKFLYDHQGFQPWYCRLDI